MLTVLLFRFRLSTVHVQRIRKWNFSIENATDFIHRKPKRMRRARARFVYAHAWNVSNEMMFWVHHLFDWNQNAFSLLYSEKNVFIWMPTQFWIYFWKNQSCSLSIRFVNFCLFHFFSSQCRKLWKSNAKIMCGFQFNQINSFSISKYFVDTNFSFEKGGNGLIKARTNISSHFTCIYIRLEFLLNYITLQFQFTDF